jgi:hypothetical protein
MATLPSAQKLMRILFYTLFTGMCALLWGCGENFNNFSVPPVPKIGFICNTQNLTCGLAEAANRSDPCKCIRETGFVEDGFVVEINDE